MFYLFIFLASLLTSVGLTWLVKGLATRWQIMDQPDSSQPQSRKIHDHPVPLLGGLAIFVSYFLFLLVFYRHFLSGNLQWSHLLGFLGGALIIIIGGILDDKYDLPPSRQIIFPILASIAILAGGVEISKLTNPWGGVLSLANLKILGSVLIILWLLGMMYTTKLLDGLDGLVSSIGAIGGFIIFLFTLTTRYYQPDLAFAAILLTGSALGFLIFNWHPAKIFLGEGGSLLIGYILGVLAIISGAKIAIALLVMGLPILDVVWTIGRRLFGGQNPFKFSDRRHLHHRLLDLGLGQRGTVIVFCSISLLFGLSGLFLQSQGKLLALLVLAFIMLLLIIALSLLGNYKRYNQTKK